MANIVIAPVLDYIENQEIVDIREVVSKSTGKRYYILVTEDAEVAMPAGWRVSARDYPEGIHPGVTVRWARMTENGFELK